MAIELTKEDRVDALASIDRYFRENMEESIGNIAAGGLLAFFLKEIGPLVYNKAVEDVQEKLRNRIEELEYEIHEAPFTYWQKRDKPAKEKKC